MKKLLLLYIFFQLFVFVGNAQIKLIGNITTNGVANYPTHIDSLGKGGYMVMPTIASRNGIPTLRRKFGMLVFVQDVDSLYKLSSPNLDNSNWVALSLTSATDQNGIIGSKLNISDTAAMLRTYQESIAALISDTALIASKLNTVNASLGDLTQSISGNLDTKLNISDTASMLSYYKSTIKDHESKITSLIYDTTTLQPRFDSKLNISDTASMLNVYLQSIIALNSDTLSLAQRITDLANATNSSITPIITQISSGLETKLNLTDTSAMLYNYRQGINASVKYVDTARMLNNYRLGITGSVKYSDTSSMFSNYLAAINDLKATKLNSTDTAHLSVSKLNIKDTSAMLKPYYDNLKSLNDDTLLIASKLNTIFATLASTGATLTSTNTNIDSKLNIADTASMLSNRFARDTANLSRRIDLANVLVNQKLNIADTASMLTKRFARDTASLSNRISINKQAIIDSALALNSRISENNSLATAKLSISDTAAMLLTYKQRLKEDSISLLSIYADTLLLSNRISVNKQAIIDSALALNNRKLNITDTLNMLNSRFARDTVSLSNRIYVNQQSIIDTAVALNSRKLNISDTSYMLNSRFARDTASLSTRINALKAASGINETIFLDSINKRLQIADTAAMLLSYKSNINALITDTGTLTTRFGFKLNLSDTSFLLQKKDTAFLSNRISVNKQAIIDSALALNSRKLNITDTSLMLSNRFARDTVSLSARINALKAATGINETIFLDSINRRLQIADTAGMLVNYKNNINALIADTGSLSTRIGYKLNSSDTAYLSNRLNINKQAIIDSSVALNIRKLNITDTALMLSSRFARDTASLSNRININKEAIIDSAVALNSRIISAFSASNTKVNYSDTANMLTNYRNSISVLINGKLDITDTSYLLQKRDTSSLSSRIYINKQAIIDSALALNSRIVSNLSITSNKVNYTDTAAMLLNYRSNLNALNADTSTLSTRFSYKLNLSDTSVMLSNRIARDTASLSNRINALSISTGINSATFLDSINKRLQISDTAGMLSNYRNTINSLISDTAKLSARIAEKLNINDTALMLSNRIARDTVSLSNRINYKLNSTDTSSMLNNRFARDTVSLSNRIEINRLAIIDTAASLKTLISNNSSTSTLKLNISDTASMLENYRRSIIALNTDTALLSERINKKLNISDTSILFSKINILTNFTDSANAQKLNITDTANMLSTRFARDTASLSVRINHLGQTVIDSSFALNARKLNLNDTASLSNRININRQAIIDSSSSLKNLITSNTSTSALKLNISDTALMLSNRFARDTSSLSNRINILNTIKQNALTAGAGITLSNNTISAAGLTIGSTNMSLGGTYTNVTGLSNLSTTSLTTSNLMVTAGTIQTGAVLTSDNAGNATWSSSGLYTLNGISGTNQTFATTTASSSTAPSIVSTGTVHNLNIPLASVAGTTAGLVSNAEYSALFVRDVTDETGVAGFLTVQSNGQTVFTLSQTPSSRSKVKMYINGVRISNAAYSLNQNKITYIPANNGSYTLLTNDRIQFDYFY